MKAAQLTGTRIEWLITGEGSQEAIVPDETSRTRELCDQLRRILHRRPDLTDHVASFFSLLSEQAQPAPPSAPSATDDWRELVPVVGSTAAGPAHFWEEIQITAGGPEADERLEELLRSHADRSVQSAGQVTAAPSTAGGQTSVALVQYSRPDELGILEFLSGTGIKQQFPAAVAWRIDGDSMSPRYEDGDFVVTSPDEPAVPGHPCVARQAGQIGVNCKLYQVRGSEVTLIPVNDRHSVQAFPSNRLQWAHRVLYVVRLH